MLTFVAFGILACGSKQARILPNTPAFVKIKFTVSNYSETCYGAALHCSLMPLYTTCSFGASPTGQGKQLRNPPHRTSFH